MKNRIRELRLAKGWTQEYVAAMLGTGHHYVSKVENQKLGVESKLDQWCKVFGVHPGELWAPLPNGDNTPDEQEALEIVRRMDPETLEMWLWTGESWLNRPVNDPKSPRRPAE